MAIGAFTMAIVKATDGFAEITMVQWFFVASPRAMSMVLLMKWRWTAMVYDGHFQQFRWNYDGHMIPKKYRNDKRRWPTMGIHFPHLRWFPFHDGFNKGESLTKL